jgi:hypothetical protein
MYQAQFLKSSGKSPNEIRRLILDWVSTEPFIFIDSQSYELDSSCSVIVQTLGNSTCIDPSSTTRSTTIPEPEANPHTPISLELATSAGVAFILLLVIIVIVISLTVYIGVRRSRKRARELQKEHTPR